MKQVVRLVLDWAQGGMVHRFSKEFRESAPRSLLLAAAPTTQNRIFVASAPVDLA